MKKIIPAYIFWIMIATSSLFSQTFDTNTRDSLKQKLTEASGIERIEILIKLADKMLVSDPDRSIQYANEALEMAVDLNFSSGEADAYFQIGEAYLLKGENIRALDFYLKAQKMYSKNNNRSGQAKSYNSCGRVYKLLGDFSTALDYHLKAMRIYENLDDKEGLANSMIFTGIVYRNLGNPELAMDYYNKAENMGRQIDDRRIISSAMVSRGNIFWYENENDKALHLYEEALASLDESEGYGDEKSGIYNNIGNVNRQNGNFKYALDFYQKSLEISKNIGDKNLIAVTLKNIGITYKMSRDYDKAIEYLNESRSIAEQIRLLAVNKESLLELSETWSKIGDYQKALMYYKEYTSLNESITEEQASDKISIMQLGYHLKEEAQKQTIREFDLEMEVLKEKNIRNVIIFITLLAVSFIFILWTRYKLKLKKNQELRLMNADLEKRVEERTKRLREENERRRIAQEHAEMANETKNKFLANISHEVRTPINAIIGFCDLTMKSDINPDLRVNLQRIKDSTEHLLALIKDVLDYSQIDKGRTQLKKVKFELKMLVESVINAFYLDAKSKKIKLTYHIDDNLPKNLIGDKDALRQVMYNLVGNALKFTESGSINVDLKVSDQETSDGQVGLFCSIKDTGIGISKMKQKLIFMDFTQEHDTSSRKYGGAGLGLTISKHFVELMDGNIWVESDKGAGSNFMFTAVLEYEPEKQKTSVTEEDTSPNGKKLHVLIAEDNILNAQVIVAFLNRMGHTSEVAKNGLEALKILSEKDFDAVLMDIEMPEMDGLEATKAIRMGKDNVKDPEIPIVALTAHALKDYEEKSMQAGMNNYLTKPVDINQLSEVLQTLKN
ncbi:MAG: tetratricopeptide repeat protein [Bacteroidales bacterium]|nr:tetratricopeptide repeat protein [Bacteroidales bacterium]